MLAQAGVGVEEQDALLFEVPRILSRQFRFTYPVAVTAVAAVMAAADAAGAACANASGTPVRHAAPTITAAASPANEWDLI